MIMRLFWLSLLLFISFNGVAQTARQSTPRETMQTFYENLLPGQENLRIAARVIYSRHVYSRSKRETYVQLLKKYLDEQGITIVYDSIPDDEDYLDSLTNKPVYIFNDVISLQKYGQSWYLAKATVNLIPDLGKKVVAEPEPGPEKLSKAEAKKEAVRQREEELAKIARMPVDLSTPYATMKFYLDNIKQDPAVAARIVASQDVPHLNDRIDIVIKLSRFFDGKGVLIDLDKVPDDPNYSDSTKQGKHTYEISYRFAEIYLEKRGEDWFLSKESAEKIPELYKVAFPFGSDKLLRYLPTEGRAEYFGLAAWQYVAILIIVILTYLVFRLLNWSITFLVTRVLFRFGYKELASKFVNPIVRPIGLLIAFVLAETATPLLQLPVKITAFVSITVELLIPLFATIAVYRAMDIIGLYMQKLADKTESTFDDQLVPLIRKILKTFVAIIGGIVVLQHLNVDVKLLLGGLSVGGLALALAAQDTIKNFFGSMMIFVDKPFQAGHWITTTDGIDGTVEEVGLRSTRIRTFANSLITVPNGKLSDAAINNHGLRAYRRFKTYISVTYDTPPDVLDLYIQGLRKIVEEHPHTRKDNYHVYMNNMGPHSLDILFYIFFITPAWGDELKYRHEVILSIIKLAHTLGVNFAFPTQTLHMETFPGQMPLSPTYEQADKLEPKLHEFFGEQKPEDKGQQKK